MKGPGHLSAGFDHYEVSNALPGRVATTRPGARDFPALLAAAPWARLG